MLPPLPRCRDPDRNCCSLVSEFVSLRRLQDRSCMYSLHRDEALEIDRFQKKTVKNCKVAAQFRDRIRTMMKSTTSRGSPSSCISVLHHRPAAAGVSIQRRRPAAACPRPPLSLSISSTPNIMAHPAQHNSNLYHSSAPSSILFLHQRPRFFSVSEFYSGGICDPETDFNQKSELSESGDPWPACLLRLKSFADLHKLWYVCLKEKNFLLGERQQVRQCSNTPNNWRNHGRLKKVKLTMKRILTVLSRREIHEQALRAKEILRAQTEREKLETRRFHLEEEQLMLKAKMKRQMKLAVNNADSSSDVDSVARQAWELTLEKNEKELRELLEKLQPLRKATMALLIPDWRYSRKYTDLPGTISWKKQWIRALDESRKLPFRFY